MCGWAVLMRWQPKAVREGVVGREAASLPATIAASNLSHGLGHHLPDGEHSRLRPRHQAEPARGSARKKRTISAEASGPVWSV